MKRCLALLCLVSLFVGVSGCSFLCKIGIDSACDDPKPTPKPTPTPPTSSELRVQGQKLFYGSREIQLFGYGDYGIFGDLANFPNDDTIRQYLDILKSYQINYIRCFLVNAGRFGPYKAVGSTDYILTKSRAVELGKNDQWNGEYWRRVNLVIDEAEKRGIMVGVVFWDHWHMYRGNHYTFPGTNYTFWDLCPYNPGGHYQCTANGWDNPPGCEDFIPLNEITGNLLFPAFYRDIPGRRGLMRELINKAVGITKQHGNVLYEVMNEPRDGSHDEIMNWHLWVVGQIEAQKPDAVVTSSPDHNHSSVDMFNQPWIDLSSFHGLGYGANCNASRIQNLNARHNKHALCDDDGCWASASYERNGQIVHTNRDDPEFVRVQVQKAKQFGHSMNTKQSYNVNNLNLGVLSVMRSEISGRPMAPGAVLPVFKGWDYTSVVPNDAE